MALFGLLTRETTLATATINRRGLFRTSSSGDAENFRTQLFHHGVDRLIVGARSAKIPDAAVTLVPELDEEFPSLWAALLQ